MWILILFLIAVGAFVAWVIHKDKKEKEERSEETAEPTEAEKYLRFIQSGTLPSSPKTPPPVPQKKDERTLDRKYAEEKGLWICRYCETLNENSSTSCAACGMQRT